MGNFDPPVAAVGGPAISGVVTAVSGANPVITWTLDDADGIASTSMTVDGKAVAVNGPYGTNTHANYSASLAGLNLASGDHTFVIYATDSAATPMSTQYIGAFTVAGNAGPTIGGVYVLPASGVMSWNAVDADGVAGASLTIDGASVSKVYGPYTAASGVNFSGQFGTLAAGNHTYVITATDKLGNASTLERPVHRGRHDQRRPGRSAACTSCRPAA